MFGSCAGWRISIETVYNLLFCLFVVYSLFVILFVFGCVLPPLISVRLLLLFFL